LLNKNLFLSSLLLFVFRVFIEVKNRMKPYLKMSVFMIGGLVLVVLSAVIASRMLSPEGQETNKYIGKGNRGRGKEKLAKNTRRLKEKRKQKTGLSLRENNENGAGKRKRKKVHSEQEESKEGAEKSSETGSGESEGISDKNNIAVQNQPEAIIEFEQRSAKTERIHRRLVYQLAKKHGYKNVKYLIKVYTGDLENQEENRKLARRRCRRVIGLFRYMGVGKKSLECKEKTVEAGTGTVADKKDSASWRKAAIIISKE
jgi:hypothetical protein